MNLKASTAAASPVPSVPTVSTTQITPDPANVQDADLQTAPVPSVPTVSTTQITPDPANVQDTNSQKTYLRKGCRVRIYPARPRPYIFYLKNVSKLVAAGLARLSMSEAAKVITISAAVVRAIEELRPMGVVR